jgi:arylsulfatase A-like enzyme/predicted negative regulator of RcsB-dependent stress response
MTGTTGFHFMLILLQRESIHFDTKVQMRIPQPHGVRCAGAAAIWIAIACLAGCGKPDASRVDAPRRPDVVLITVDTLRADRVGATGGSAGVTPAIDELARGGATFLDATAHVPLTLPSHTSILTGRYPIAHGVHDNSGFTLGADVPTLATILHGLGYHTAAFVSSFVLRAATGLSRGFDRYDDRFEGAGRAHVTTASLERRAAEVARDVTQWLAAAPHPFFLWVHFYDPHAPYEPPPAFAARFAGRPYDGEVATADFGVGGVIGALPAATRGNTLIVVTADHGESMGEHGESEHGILLYDATLHVPLVIQGPGVGAGVRVDRQVRHVDLLPTIAEVLGIPPPAGIDGVSLAPLLRGAAAVETRAGVNNANEAPTSYAESRFGELHFGWRPIRSLRDGDWKYIDGGAPELYHVRSDQAERDDITGSHADTAAGMAKALGALAGARPATTVADSEVAERLRSLGYVTGRVELGGGNGDPRREIVRYEAYVKRFNAAAGALDNGRARDAETTFRQLTREFPRAFEAHQYLARALVARHATKEAVAELEMSIQLSPREPVLYFDAARALADEGEFDRAFRRVDEGRRLEPTSFYGPLTEGVVARAAGQTDRAEHAFQAALQMNPTLAAAHYELGAIAESHHDRDRARREYQRALDDDSTLDIARAGLARLAR